MKHKREGVEEKFYTEERPHEEAEKQRMALRRGKNLTFSEETCLEEERVWSKATPRNSTFIAE